jgi:hypothetical protein
MKTFSINLATEKEMAEIKIKAINLSAELKGKSGVEFTLVKLYCYVNLNIILFLFFIL